MRASTLFAGRGTWVKDAHACEVVRGLTVGQYVEQAEKVPAESSGGRHVDGKRKKVRSL
jgi:hypothetical protein